MDVFLYPAKVAGALGDGGAVINVDDGLAEFSKSRDHGRGEGLRLSIGDEIAVRQLKCKGINREVKRFRKINQQEEN